MKNMDKVSNTYAHVKDELMELIKKFVPTEELLKQPEEAYAVAKMFELFDDCKDMAEDLAKELDETNELCKNTLDLLKKVDNEIIELRDEITELRREVIKAQ